jgi:glycosyltransferase involved in cell wall biosynthesis
MRVGLLIYGSLDTLSGGYLYDRKLVAHLRAQGDRVEIISLPWRSYPRHLLDNFSSALRRKLRGLSLDVLIQDELNHPSLAWLNHRLRVPYPVLALVHHLRCDELRPTWQNRFYRWVERCYLESVTGFIFNSQTTRVSVARVAPLESRPWVVATPAGDRFAPQISDAEIMARARQPGSLRLLFLGNLIPRKGLHTLIEALAQLERGCCTLDVIGSPQADPRYARRIRALVRQRGLQASIRFWGALEDAALAQKLHASQLLVVPSSYEGFGIVYLEGLGFGLPEIGTTLGGASEIIIPGETGYLIEPEDSRWLAIILEKLHQNRNLLESQSLAARQRYAHFPGWTQSMTKVRSFLQGVVGS